MGGPANAVATWAGAGLTALVQVLVARECVGCRRPAYDLCPPCAAQLRSAAGPADPVPCPPGLPPTYASAGYESAVREAVVQFKERGRGGLRGPLSRALAGSVAAALLGTGGLPDSLVLVPVPSSPDAARSRDTAATLDLARSAARMLRGQGLPTRCWTGLRAVRRRADQTGLTAPERARNLAGSMAVTAGGPARSALRGGEVVLVDDVVTTGATLAEAARALAAGGIEVRAAAVVAATARRLPLARADPGRRSGKQARAASGPG